MGESFENNKNDLPNEDAKKWDILSEDTEVPEGEYDAAPTENPDGTEIQMSVPEENLPHREVYETTAAEDYDGARSFLLMEDPEMRSEMRKTLSQRDRLAKEGLTPMDVFCAYDRDAREGTEDYLRPKSGFYEPDLDTLIDSSIDKNTTIEELNTLYDYFGTQVVRVDRAPEPQFTHADSYNERIKNLSQEYLESILEHAGDDLFLKGDDEATQKLLYNLLNNESHPLDLIKRLKAKFTFGEAANKFLEILLKASSEPVANGGGESVFTDPTYAEALEEGMSPEVKAKVVSSIIEDDKSIAGVIDALPPEQIAKLLKLVSARAEDISTNEAQL